MEPFRCPPFLSTATRTWRSWSARALRLRACEALERATQLRRRAEHVLSTVRATVFPTLAEQSSPASAAGGTEPPDEADALQWYRDEIRRMLAAGWSRAELADVGVTDALLHELGLHWSAAG
jgi:hypothetical protein